MSGQAEDVPPSRQRRPVFLRPWFALLAMGLTAVITGFALMGRTVPPAPPAGLGHHGQRAPTGYAYPPTGKSSAMNGTGIYRVGMDVKPGLYRSVNNGASPRCTWARFDRATGRKVTMLESVIPVDGTLYVRLSSGDDFRSENCSPWLLQQEDVGPTPPAVSVQRSAPSAAARSRGGLSIG